MPTLKMEVFIIETSSNIFKVRSNVVSCVCYYFMHIQPIVNMSYSSHKTNLIKLLPLLSLQPIINKSHHLTSAITDWSTLTTVCYNDIYLALANIKFNTFYSVASWMNLVKNTATSKIWAFINCACCIQNPSLYLAVTWHNMTYEGFIVALGKL